MKSTRVICSTQFNQVALIIAIIIIKVVVLVWAIDRKQERNENHTYQIDQRLGGPDTLIWLTPRKWLSAILIIYAITDQMPLYEAGH